MSKFIRYNASAGSGKTFTLTKTYIDLAFSIEDYNDHENHKRPFEKSDPIVINEVLAQKYNDEAIELSKDIKYALRDRYKHILAITFTNNATAEMKQRIMKELVKMSSLEKPSDMLKKIIEDRYGKEGKPIEELIKTYHHLFAKFAKEVHSAILHDYSDFAVSTIDSFMQRIVRTFAHELNLPADYDIVLDKDEIISTIMDNLMSEIGNSKDLTDLIMAFSNAKLGDGNSINIENDIKSQCESIFLEDTNRYLGLIKYSDNATFMEAVRQITEQMDEDNNKYLNQVREASKKFQDAYGDFTPTGWSNAHKYGRKFASIKNVADIVPAKKTTIAALTKDSVPPDAQFALSELVNLTTENQTPEVPSHELTLVYSRKALRNNLYTLALLKRLKELVQEFYHETQMVNIAEVSEKVHDVVCNEYTPFIYERVGTYYWNYLIDEFQDTSRMQWENMVPLVQESMATNNASLIVGDGKQAIYRFRKGEVQQFVDIPLVKDENNKITNDFSSFFHDESLDTNYRSHENIIRFNNEFFHFVVTEIFNQNDLIKKIYLGTDKNGNSLPTHTPKEQTALWQKVKQVNNKTASEKVGGYVECSVFAKKDYKVNVNNKILNIIQKQTEELNYDYKDICILTRNNKESIEIAEFLMSNGIPVMSSESMLLNRSKAVTLINTTLQYLINSNDKATTVQMIVLLQELGLIKDVRNHYYIKGQKNVEQIIQENSIDPNDPITLDRKELLKLSLFDCVETIIRQLHLSEIEIDYTADYLNRVADYSVRNTQDISTFLKWYNNACFGSNNQKEDKGFSAQAPKGINAIELMTAHKSKGLERPIVIFPTYGNNGNRNNGALWVNTADSSSAIDAESQADNILKQQLGLKRELIEDLGAVQINNNKNRTIEGFERVKDIEAEKKELDDLNILYVALTRPTDKLFFFAMQTRENEEPDPKTLVGMLSCFYKADHPLRYGEDSPKTIDSQKDTENSEPIKITSISAPPMGDRIKIAVSRTMTKAQEIGKMVHDTMAMVKTKDDVNKAINEYCRHHQIEEDERKELLLRVCSIVNNPQCAVFFAPDAVVKNECSIYAEVKNRDGKKEWCEKRPDRIVFADNHVYVVDYKTGDHHDEEYFQQVNTYCDILEQMGHHNISGHLVFIATNGDCSVQDVPRQQSLEL